MHVRFVSFNKARKCQGLTPSQPSELVGHDGVFGLKFSIPCQSESFPGRLVASLIFASSVPVSFRTGFSFKPTPESPLPPRSLCWAPIKTSLSFEFLSQASEGIFPDVPLHSGRSPPFMGVEILFFLV